MDKIVLSCIDGSAMSTAVCDAGAWASQRLNAPLKLLHVLDKTEYPSAQRPAGHQNLAGNIGLGSRENLLEELTALDERRSRLALEHGKHLLEAAANRASETGARDISHLQRHGNLVETLMELETEIRLLVMGRQGESHEHVAHCMGSHLENVVRTLQRPILIAVQDFVPPQAFMLAFDGSPTAEKVLDMVASSPLLQHLPCHLLMVDGDSQEKQQRLARANDKLQVAGFIVIMGSLQGDVQQALLAYQREHNLGLIVMGAYGHSRIRQFFVGSNTSKMVRMSDVPLLLLR